MKITKDMLVNYFTDSAHVRQEWEENGWTYYLHVLEDGTLADNCNEADHTYTETVGGDWCYVNTDALYDEFESLANADFISMIDSFLSQLEEDGYEVDHYSSSVEEALAKLKAEQQSLSAKLVEGRNSEICGRVNFSGMNLNGLDLSGMDLRGANFSHAKLIGTNLSRTILTQAVMVGCDMTGVIMVGANCKHSSMCNSVMVDSNLQGADFEEAAMHGVDMLRCDASDASFYETDLREGRLCNGNFRGAHGLERANLTDADLEDADLTDTALEESEEAWE